MRSKSIDSLYVIRKVRYSEWVAHIGQKIQGQILRIIEDKRAAKRIYKMWDQASSTLGDRKFILEEIKFPFHELSLNI